MIIKYIQVIRVVFKMASRKKSGKNGKTLNNFNYI